MKKLLFLLLLPFVFACSDNDDYKEDIVGTWKMTKSDSYNIMKFDSSNVHSEEWINGELMFELTKRYILTSSEITYPDSPTSNVHYKLKGDQLSILVHPSFEGSKEIWTDYFRIKD